MVPPVSTTNLPPMAIAVIAELVSREQTANTAVSTQINTENTEKSLSLMVPHKLVLSRVKLSPNRQRDKMHFD